MVFEILYFRAMCLLVAAKKPLVYFHRVLRLNTGHLTLAQCSSHVLAQFLNCNLTIRLPTCTCSRPNPIPSVRCSISVFLASDRRKALRLILLTHLPGSPPSSGPAFPKSRVDRLRITRAFHPISGRSQLIPFWFFPFKWGFVILLISL